MDIIKYYLLLNSTELKCYNQAKTMKFGFKIYLLYTILHRGVLFLDWYIFIFLGKEF